MDVSGNVAEVSAAFTALSESEQLEVASRLLEIQQSGWKPFWCPNPKCDGFPHKLPDGSIDPKWAHNHARVDQRLPPWQEAWIMAVLSGRGAGKTTTGVEFATLASRKGLTGAWIITTPPAGVDIQYVYPIVETGDTLAWDGTGWHHLSPAGVWTPVTGGPTNPLPYTWKVTYTDTETWVGDSTPGNGRWWSPGGGWRDDHRNAPYTQMWGLAEGAVWTDGTDYWRTKPGGWNSIPTPDPLLGFDSFAGDYNHVVGYNSQGGYWGYSIQGGPWVLGLRERIYLLEHHQIAIENCLAALENP